MNENSLEARVLLCDPNNLISSPIFDSFHKRFGGEKPLSTDELGKDGADINSFHYGNVEFTLVRDIKHIKKIMSDKPSPYYSFIAYEIEQLKKEGSPGIVAYVRKKDFFLPQIAVGSGLNGDLAGHCSRAGILYFAESSEDILQEIRVIFREPHTLSNLTLIKIGGSGFDFDRQNKQELNLEHICQILSGIHQERGTTRKTRKVNRIIVTAGAGQYGEIVKDQMAKYGHIEEVKNRYPQTMAEALQANLKFIQPYFGGRATLLTTGAFYHIDKNSTSRSIPLIGTAPHYIMVKDQISLGDSDTHTIALAEFYGASRVILIKRTDGIYNFDPYRGFIFDGARNDCADLSKWLKTQQDNNNARRSIVTINDLLDEKISREGTGIDGRADGSTGHIIEDSALRYMSGCSHVKEVLVVHISPGELFYPIGNSRYKHVITGDEVYIDPLRGWKSILEKNLLNAFNGIANSKIVRE